MEKQFGLGFRGVQQASNYVSGMIKNFEPEITRAQAKKEGGKVAKVVRELEGYSMDAMGCMEGAKKSGRKKIVARRRKGTADGLVQQQISKFLALNRPGARFDGVGGEVLDGGVRDDDQGRDRKRSISGASTTSTPAKKRKNSEKKKSPRRK